MTEVNFYHLTKSSLEQALPRLLERTLQAGERAVVLLGSAEGLLVIGILLSIAAAVLGREHPVFASSRSLVAFERFQHFTETGEWPLPNVAARKGS